MKKKIDCIAMTPGEMFDRFTILLRKNHFDSNTYNKQVQEYKKLMKDWGLPIELIESLCLLQMINTDIWNLESDIRKGKEGKLGNEEVGRRALAIRDINNKRIEMVNKLNILFGVDQQEKKYEHASQ